MTDALNPEHYRYGAIEVIDIIEQWQLGFHTGNAVKYLLRAGHKQDAAEDLRKGCWYLQRALAKNKDMRRNIRETHTMPCSDVVVALKLGPMKAEALQAIFVGDYRAALGCFRSLADIAEAQEGGLHDKA